MVMSNVDKSDINRQKTEEEFYHSLEEWQAKNFPNLIRKKERRRLERNLEALGVAIADNISRKIKSELENPKT
jgi:chromatin segregation and condensation protein Rec8/ScpA/Scc1 (kleisin family)